MVRIAIAIKVVAILFYCQNIFVGIILVGDENYSLEHFQLWKDKNFPHYGSALKYVISKYMHIFVYF